MIMEKVIGQLRQQRTISLFIKSYCIFLLLFFSCIAEAVQVSPIKVELSSKKSVDSITVTNDDPENSIVFKNSIMRWTKSGQKDVYSPSKDMIVAPPIMTIPPNHHQIIRLGLRDKITSDREVAYRLILQQIVSKPKPGFKGVIVAMRLSLPIYVAPNHVIKNRLQWKIGKTNDQLIVTLTNNNNVHQVVNKLILTNPIDKKVLATNNDPVSVFPYQFKQWKFNISKLPQFNSVDLFADIDTGTINESFDLS